MWIKSAPRPEAGWAGSELASVRQKFEGDVVRHQVRLISEFEADVVSCGANIVAEHATIIGADDGPLT
jgi:hypothetical protein